MKPFWHYTLAMAVAAFFAVGLIVGIGLWVDVGDAGGFLIGLGAWFAVWIYCIRVDWL